VNPIHKFEKNQLKILIYCSVIYSVYKWRNELSFGWTVPLTSRSLRHLRTNIILSGSVGLLHFGWMHFPTGRMWFVVKVVHSGWRLFCPLHLNLKKPHKKYEQRIVDFSWNCVVFSLLLFKFQIECLNRSFLNSEYTILHHTDKFRGARNNKVGQCKVFWDA